MTARCSSPRWRRWSRVALERSVPVKGWATCGPHPRPLPRRGEGELSLGSEPSPLAGEGGARAPGEGPKRALTQGLRPGYIDAARHGGLTYSEFLSWIIQTNPH